MALNNIIPQMMPTLGGDWLSWQSGNFEIQKYLLLVKTMDIISNPSFTILFVKLNKLLSLMIGP